MRIAICEDEKEVGDWLLERVRSQCPQAEAWLCQSGEELLLADRQPDILLLDIQMPGKNGMETAREFRRENKEAILIFVTALEEYVFQAFDVGAFHYLVKPFGDEKLAEVLGNAAEQLKQRQKFSPGGQERHILVKSGGQHIKVLLDDIVYAEVFNRKVILHKMEEDIVYYGRLSELEKKVGEDFFRSHRAYLVNLKYVVRYDASSIWLEKGTALMAKQNYSKFVKGYLKYNQRKEREGQPW